MARLLRWQTLVKSRDDIEESLADRQLETLFVIHPETESIRACALEAWVERLNSRLAASAVTRDLQVFCIGGLHTRRSPYPSFQVLRRSLEAVGMPRDSGNVYSVVAPHEGKERP